MVRENVDPRKRTKPRKRWHEPRSETEPNPGNRVHTNPGTVRAHPENGGTRQPWKARRVLRERKGEDEEEVEDDRGEDEDEDEKEDDEKDEQHGEDDDDDNDDVSTPSPKMFRDIASLKAFPEQIGEL